MAWHTGSHEPDRRVDVDINSSRRCNTFPTTPEGRIGSPANFDPCGHQNPKKDLEPVGDKHVILFLIIVTPLTGTVIG